MRIPLHFKLMVSYLLVVGLVFLPTFIYLRTIQRGEMRASMQAELDAEVGALSERLSATQPERMGEVVALLMSLVPQRLTIVDPQGNVIADSRVPGLRENHLTRPEIQQALNAPDGRGSSLRKSATTKEVMLYSAIRFPATGTPRGVVRLSIPTAAMDATERKGSSFVNRAGAVALSAAVLLSLVAALVVSRPLRRITQAARAFAAGDFGHPIDVFTNDELGDAALALGELAAQLRGRLLSSGADRAALHALLDDLPVGVILYDPHGTPVVINGRARELCELSPNQELERARQIAELEQQAPVVAQVLHDGVTAEAPLALPWVAASQPLRARWISIFAPDGDRQPALVVLDGQEEAAKTDKLVRGLERCVIRLRDAAHALPPTSPLASECEQLAEEAEALVPQPPPRPQQVQAVRLGDVCRDALGDLSPLAQSAGVTVEMELVDQEAKVVEAGERTRRAVRQLVRAAMRDASRGGTVRVTGELLDARVKLSVRTHTPPQGWPLLAQQLQCLGGDAALQRDGSETEAWVLLPKA